MHTGGLLSCLLSICVDAFLYLIDTALFFGFSYCISYTCARTLNAAPYEFDSLIIGVVLLSFGVGE